MERAIIANEFLLERLEAARKRLDAGKLQEVDELLGEILSIELAEPSEETIIAQQAILRLALDLGDTWIKRSEMLVRGGKMDEGVEAFERVAELKTLIAQMHERLADTYLAIWNFELGIAAYQSALRLLPEEESLQKKLANAIANKDQPENVLAFCQGAIARAADPAAARLQLANALRTYRRLDEAIAEYRRVIELQPKAAAAYNNMGIALKDSGRVEEALAELGRAAELAPNSAVIQSNRLYTFSFHPGDNRQIIYAAHREWSERFTAGMVDGRGDYANDRSADRPLRIGYVSPDFREHCQAFFTVPLLEAHDSKNVEVYCYADVPRADAVTDRLRKCAKVWRDILGLSDLRVCDLIRADRIDILVDLTMHMAGNRQMVFARKPAPIQITWLAYPGTTGQTAIDYRISDPYLDPPELGEAGYSEKTIRLPESFWCYDPLRAAEPITPLPAIRNGFVTFGCLNNFCKVNEFTLRLWGDVLRRVADSRFILLAPAGEARQRAIQLMGVADARVEFVDYRPRAEYLKQYEQIDICLDTFPYNGHTTSLDAMWMGVPVVSLCGKTAPARGGFSQASNLGLTELVAHSPEQFVATAVQLAKNRSFVSQLRGELRYRLSSSPLMDAPRFARGLESLYRRVWRDQLERSGL